MEAVIKLRPEELIEEFFEQLKQMTKNAQRIEIRVNGIDAANNLSDEEIDTRLKLFSAGKTISFTLEEFKAYATEIGEALFLNNTHAPSICENWKAVIFEQIKSSDDSNAQNKGWKSDEEYQNSCWKKMGEIGEGSKNFPWATTLVERLEAGIERSEAPWTGENKTKVSKRVIEWTIE